MRQRKQNAGLKIWCLASRRAHHCPLTCTPSRTIKESQDMKPYKLQAPPVYFNNLVTITDRYYISLLGLCQIKGLTSNSDFVNRLPLSILHAELDGLQQHFIFLTAWAYHGKLRNHKQCNTKLYMLYRYMWLIWHVAHFLWCNHAFTQTMKSEILPNCEMRCFLVSYGFICSKIKHILRITVYYKLADDWHWQKMWKLRNVYFCFTQSDWHRTLSIITLERSISQ